MPKSITSSNNIMGLLYNATPWANVADNAAASPLTNVYVSLHTASLTPSSTQTTSESTYTNYARVAVPRTTSGWTAPASGSTSNVASVEFLQCGVTGNTITTAAVGKAVSAASDVYHYGDLNSPIIVSDQIQPRFAIGAITITES